MGERDLGLDFVKGFLVVVMVLYHAMNYFSTAGPEYYGYLRFINGAFVFISGYIVGIHYFDRSRSEPWPVGRRLIVRGLKLLLVFTFLNLCIAAIGLKSYKNFEFGIGSFIDNLGVIYGSGNGKVMAFQILVPIAYVILLSPLYIALPRVARMVLMAVTAVVAFGYGFLPIEAPNAYFAIVGLVGLCIGMLLPLSTQRTIDNPVVLVAGIVLLGAIMNDLSGNALLYAVGIAAFLKLVYEGTRRIDLRALWSRVLILFGQYSLVCYIAQIGFLYGIYLVLAKPRWPPGLELVLVFLATNALLVALSVAIRHSRRRYPLADKAYKFVFA